MDKVNNIKTLEIKCLRCSAVFRVPVKYCGENILCDQCGILIVVPTLDELREPEDDSRHSIQYEALSDETIKINREGLKQPPDESLKTILQTSNFITPKLKNRKNRRKFFR